VYDVLEQSATRSTRHLRVVALSLRMTTAMALAVDACVHWDLTARYAGNVGTGALTQGDLFRVEAIVSALVAVMLMATGRILAWAVGWLVAASAVGAVLLYHSYDPGQLGPLPDMYEPVWFREKVVAAAAEGLAVVTASAGMAEAWWRGHTSQSL
jgi:hypothetical protein